MSKAKKMMAILLVLGIAVCTVLDVSAGENPKDVIAKSSTININKASLEQLSDLNGVGDKYAERIIQYREKHGPFKRVEDITNVQGIGPKTLAANKGILTVK